MGIASPNPLLRAVETERLRRLFLLFGATQARGHSRVYEALSETAAADATLLDLMLEAPAHQRRPSLLFAAVNLLLASEPDADLAAYYPIHGGRRAVDDGLVLAFTAFWRARREALLRLLRERSTQTNEVRRCVALHLGLDYVCSHWPGPLALVEVGASAGLNLLFDRYRYRLNGHETTAVGASQVAISSEVRGTFQEGLLGRPPLITVRLGIDQQPINLAEPDSRAWLEAFIWPEQERELATLRGAINLTLSSRAFTVVTGDATRDTARVIGALPGREPVTVFTASLLSYLTADARAAFLGQLREAAERRPLAWVYAEAPGLLTTMRLDLPALAGPLARNTANYVVGASLFAPTRHDRLLAIADAYLRWLAPARGPTDDFQWVAKD